MERNILTTLTFTPDEVLEALRGLHSEIPADAKIRVALPASRDAQGPRTIIKVDQVEPIKLPAKMGGRTLHGIRDLSFVMGCEITWEHPDGSEVTEPKNT